MKTLTFALTAGLIATSALAGNSDRYNDLRLDTRVGHVADSQDTVALQKTTSPSVQSITFSTRNAEANQPSYPYTNPFGVGPYNDGR